MYIMPIPSRSFSFDLLSDLHAESWPDFDWTGQPTSPYCVLTGDIATGTERVVEILTHLGHCYQAVFYIDGNSEHSQNLKDISGNNDIIMRSISHLENVVFMQDQLIVIHGVAIIAANGWWGFNMDANIDDTEAMTWYQGRNDITLAGMLDIRNRAYHDATYMVHGVRKLQKHPDVQAIVAVTHTVPGPWLLTHDPELVGDYKFNCMGNQHMQAVLEADTQRKIHTWCFGHYHSPVDRFHEGVRYVNNCRGKGNTEYSQIAYYPKRIVIDY